MLANRIRMSYISKKDPIEELNLLSFPVSLNGVAQTTSIEIQHLIEDIRYCLPFTARIDMVHGDKPNIIRFTGFWSRKAIDETIILTTNDFKDYTDPNHYLNFEVLHNGAKGEVVFLKDNLQGIVLGRFPFGE